MTENDVFLPFRPHPHNKWKEWMGWSRPLSIKGKQKVGCYFLRSQYLKMYTDINQIGDITYSYTDLYSLLGPICSLLIFREGSVIYILCMFCHGPPLYSLSILIIFSRIFMPRTSKKIQSQIQNQNTDCTTSTTPDIHQTRHPSHSV